MQRPTQGTEMDRRQFLKALGLSVGVATVGTRPTALGAETETETLVGSNVYGWTQYAEREKQPFDVGAVLSALRDCGYDYLESWMNLDRPEENARFAEQLKAKGMRPVSLYTGARLHEASSAEQVTAKILAAAKVCREAGFSVISCNPDPIGREKTEAELAQQVAALKVLGQGLNQVGMRLALHHHLPEMAGQAREFHFNFRHTDPAVVGFCYDVHWVWKGGLGPAEVLPAYGHRVLTWHLRQSRDGVWWEDLDTGDVDYAYVARYARTHRLPRRFTVELALEGGTRVTRSATENHRRSREFVRRVFENAAG